jgi:hypothetical protein
MRCSGQDRLTTRRATRLLPVFAIALWSLGSPRLALGAEAVASISVSAQIASRTSLKVSTHSLQFDVVNPSESATASIDFSAAARTVAGMDVVLSIEPVTAFADSGELDAAASTLTFVGEGEGTRGGTLVGGTSSVAARWTGSGHRTGRLVFALRTRASGSYTVPVRFVLSAP